MDRHSETGSDTVGILRAITAVWIEPLLTSLRNLPGLHSVRGKGQVCGYARNAYENAAPRTDARRDESGQRLTFMNMRSSACSAMQSCSAVHFPMPHLAANLVHLPSSPASIVGS